MKRNKWGGGKREKERENSSKHLLMTGREGERGRREREKDERESGEVEEGNPTHNGLTTASRDHITQQVWPMRSLY